MTTTPAGVQVPDSLRPYIPAIVNEGLPTHIAMKSGPNRENAVAITGTVDLANYIKQQKCEDRFRKLSGKLPKIRMNIVASSNGHPIDVKCETFGPFTDAQKKLIGELRSHIAERANTVLTEISAKVSKPAEPQKPAPPLISTEAVRRQNLARLGMLRAANDKMIVDAAVAGDHKAVAMANQIGTWFDELDAKIRTRKTFSRVNKVAFGRGAREIFIGVEGIDKAPTTVPVPPTTRKPMMVAKAANHTTTKIYATPDRLISETSSPKYKVPMKYALPKASFDSIISVVTDLGRNKKPFNAKHVVARLKKAMKTPPATSWTTKVLCLLRKGNALGRSKRSYVLAWSSLTASAISRKVWNSLQVR